MPVNSKTGKIPVGKVLMIGPVPPPFGGGMGEYMHLVRESDLSSLVDLTFMDTTVPLIYFRHPKLRVFLTCKFLAQLFLRLLSLRPDIVHIHTSAFMGFWEKSVMGLLCKWSGSRLVMHIHGSGFKEFYESTSHKALFAKALNICDYLIVLSQSWKEFFGPIIGSNKIVIVENGVNTSMLIPHNKQTSRSKVTVLFVGALGERKGVYTILDTIKLFPELQEDKIRFVFLGGETFTGDYQKAVDAFSKSNINNVEFKGIVIGEEKFRYFTGADVFLLPSFAENLPIAILEAMAASLPVVSTTVGGIPDIIGKNNGILVQPGNPEQLGEALLKLIHSPELRQDMGRTNRLLVEQRFSVNSIVNKLSTLYSNLRVKSDG